MSDQVMPKKKNQIKKTNAPLPLPILFVVIKVVSHGHVVPEVMQPRKENLKHLLATLANMQVTMRKMEKSLGIKKA